MDTTGFSGALAHQGALPAEDASEAALLGAARTDPAAFEELYRRHCRAIWRYLRHRTGESHAADDLLGEVFLEFLRGLPGFRLRGTGVRGWLYRVASRRVARWSRQRDRAERLEDAPARPAEESEDEAAHDPQHVRAVLDALPERMQVVLVLHHLEGLAVEEISRALGVREGTVKSRLARGRELLRRRLESRGDPR